MKSIRLSNSVTRLGDFSKFLVTKRPNIYLLLGYFGNAAVATFSPLLQKFGLILFLYLVTLEYQSHTISNETMC